MILPVFAPTLFMPKTGGGPFNPTSLVGSQGGFWRADMGITGGASPTAWADQSSNGNNLSLLGSLSWSATGFNTSFPGIIYTAGINAMDISTLSFNAASFSFLMLYTNRSGAGSSPGTRNAIFVANGATHDYDNANSMALSLVDTTTAAKAASFYDGSETANYTVTVDTPYVNGGICSSGSYQPYSDFLSQGSPTTMGGNLGAAGSNFFAIGSSNSQTSGTNCAGLTVAWALLTNIALAAGDLTNLKTWTNSNWGTSF